MLNARIPLRNISRHARSLKFHYGRDRPQFPALVINLGIGLQQQPVPKFLHPVHVKLTGCANPLSEGLDYGRADRSDCVIRYSARFVLIEGLEHREIGPWIELGALDREAAISEVSALLRPLGANFVEVSENGQTALWVAL